MRYGITSIESYEQGWCWWPKSVLAMSDYAESYGWDVRIGFSRGEIPGRKMDAVEVQDTIGIWINGYGKRAVALWKRRPESETDSAYQWTTDGSIIWADGRPGVAFSYANHTDLKHWLSKAGAVGEDWYVIVRAWVQAHEEKALRAAQSKPKAAKKAKEHA